MNEYIEVRFRKKNKPLRIARQVPGGIEFDEPDPIERTVLYQFRGRSEATRERMRNIRRINGWAPGEFRLKASVEDGSIIFRGVHEHALPDGHYEMRLQIEEASVSTKNRYVAVARDRAGSLVLDVALDERAVEASLDDCDSRIAAVLGRSRVEGEEAARWLRRADRRATRRACLLNLLASLRVRPTVSSPLVDLVHDVYWVGNDRIFTKVDREFLGRVENLAKDRSKRFYAEGPPAAPIHGRLLATLPEPPERKVDFRTLLSFRGEGKPSLQTVVAVPPAHLPYTYAEFDLDLHNPLQDLLGFVGHMGELLDGKSTNHLDLRKELARTKAKDYLYYTIRSANGAGR